MRPPQPDLLIGVVEAACSYAVSAAATCPMWSRCAPANDSATSHRHPGRASGSAPPLALVMASSLPCTQGNCRKIDRFTTRRARSGIWDARLTGLRAAAEADAARRRGDHRQAAREQERARSFRALEEVYRQRETVFTAVMADRTD
jgi:hypothetical protein